MPAEPSCRAVPVTGGAMEELQTLPSQTSDAGVTEEPVLLGRTPNHALLVANAVQDKSHRNALVRRRR